MRQPAWKTEYRLSCRDLPAVNLTGNLSLVLVTWWGKGQSLPILGLYALLLVYFLDSLAFLHLVQAVLKD